MNKSMPATFHAGDERIQSIAGKIDSGKGQYSFGHSVPVSCRGYTTLIIRTRVFRMVMIFYALKDQNHLCVIASLREIFIPTKTQCRILNIQGAAITV